MLIALAGPAHAVAERIGDGSVGTRHLKDRAVTAPKLAPNAVSGTKVVNGTVGIAHLAPNARRPQAVGADPGGSVNIPANQWTDVLTMRLPAGSWNLFAKGIITTFDSFVTCDLVVGDTIVDRTSAYGGVSGAEFGFGDSPMSLISMTTASSSSRSVTLRCHSNQNTPAVKDTKIVAIATRA
ncbi:hypothetical protein [Nocardioides speluncae]|uniref:hypothetical protein n=1 Tax=Nocardioides speluncae TaxID=2670337 RepID=UPI000D69B16A|nr:hypothetical protein [Nocardioides speluncae]